MRTALPDGIRAVLFDVDGTLYAQTPLRVAMAVEMAVAAASPARARRQAVSRVLAFRRLRERLRSEAGSSEPLATRQYRVVSEHLGCSEAEVVSAVDEWIYRRPTKWLRYCRRPGIAELLDYLRGRRIACGVFSDYPAEDKLAALGIRDRFELVLSAVDPDIGAFKPDPRGFVEAARKWNMPASDVLYVGDRADVDAAGALAAGMPCAVLTAGQPGAGQEFIAVRDFKELQRVLSRSH